jgi:hypothetical protein
MFRIAEVMDVGIIIAEVMDVREVGNCGSNGC